MNEKIILQYKCKIYFFLLSFLLSFFPSFFGVIARNRNTVMRTQCFDHGPGPAGRVYDFWGLKIPL